MLHHRVVWPLRSLVGAIFLFALFQGFRVPGHQAARASLTLPSPPHALLVGDADRDGLPDVLEAALAARFAPAVILNPQDHTRPISIPWLLAKLGRRDAGQDEFPAALRSGSSDPRDWVTYVHVYPRTDGEINIQYWFLYAYNERPPFFDHDADWEHVTVVVEPNGRPRGAFFAQHRNNNPGVFRPWSELRKVGEHPIVLSARGTHASYANHDSLAWYEAASDCTGLERCGDPIWPTWEAGGLLNVGERGALLGPAAVRDALAYAGRWGGEGHFPRSRAAPPGPSHQRGFTADGFE